MFDCILYREDDVLNEIESLNGTEGAAKEQPKQVRQIYHSSLFNYEKKCFILYPSQRSQ